MAKIEDMGIPGVGTGILMPLIQFRWRIIFDTLHEKPESDYQLLSMQAIRIKFNFVDKEMKVVFEQSIVGDEHSLLLKMLEHPHFCPSIRVDAMDGNEGMYHSVVLTSPVFKKHTFKLDYAKSGTAKHKVTFSFKNLRIYIPEKKNPTEVGS